MGQSAAVPIAVANTYAGGGKFSREEELLNIVHVGELIRESGWRPRAGFHAPPRQPRR